MIAVRRLNQASAAAGTHHAGYGRGCCLARLADVAGLHGGTLDTRRHSSGLCRDDGARGGGDAVFGALTVSENLRLGAIRQPDKSGIDEILLLFPKLGRRLNQTAGTLSGGERKMLAIGRALLGRPRLLLLDEPTEGVWIGVIEEIEQRLRQLATEISIILVEQHVELALRVATKAYVLDRGRLVLGGPSIEVRNNPLLLRYLAP